MLVHEAKLKHHLKAHKSLNIFESRIVFKLWNLLLFVCLVPTTAQSALILSIEEYTTDTFVFSISGTFDADTVGTPFAGFLGVKWDYEGNPGSHTDFISPDAGDVGNPLYSSGSLTFNGIAQLPSFAPTTGTFADSIRFGNPSGGAGTPFAAGTVVSGTISVDLSGEPISFLLVDPLSFDLVSGLNGGFTSWNRLEASATLVSGVPEPSSFLLLGLASLTLLLLRFRRSTNQSETMTV